MLESNNQLKQTVTVFSTPQANPEDIAKAGEEVLLSLYSASTLNSVDDFRLAAFKRKNAKKSMHSVFQVASLPPTSAAARQHSFWTYCQVQQWLENNIDPNAWGWILSYGSLLPNPTGLPPASDKLVRIVSCNCKAGCIRGCGCRRAGIAPQSATCTGLECNNALALTDISKD